MRVLKYLFIILISVGLLLEVFWLISGKEDSFLITSGLLLHGVGLMLQIIHDAIRFINKRKIGQS